MAQKRSQPYVWVTWLSKVMAGENACVWASWFRSHHQHYENLPGTLNLAQWNIEHTRLLTETRSIPLRNGATLRIESQNSFKFNHASGAVIAGKPDLVSLQDTVATVSDCKTGRPKTSDRVQVMIYMFVLPYCFPELAMYSIRGRVIYRDHEIEIDPSGIDRRFEENLDYFVNLVASADAPPPAPSSWECRFCDIGCADCAARPPHA